MTALKVPRFKEPGLSEFLTDMIVERDRVRKNALRSDTANNSVLLYSPSKKVYEVKVSDAGALTVTLVSG